MQHASKTHVKTAWKSYAACGKCSVPAGDPCIDLAAFARTGKIFRRDQPHVDRTVQR